MNKKTIIMTATAIVAVSAVAAIASYSTKKAIESENAKTAVVTKSTGNPAPQPQRVAAAPHAPAQQAVPACDDKNIVGTVAGGVAGGVVGSKIGKGSGKTAATIGGVAGGALLGNEFIPTRNVTCR